MACSDRSCLGGIRESSVRSGPESTLVAVTDVAVVSVSAQDRAKAFYVDTLGLQLLRDRRSEHGPQRDGRGNAGNQPADTPVDDPGQQRGLEPAENYETDTTGRSRGASRRVGSCRWIGLHAGSISPAASGRPLLTCRFMTRR
jgi:hypothetical protein